MGKEAEKSMIVVKESSFSHTNNWLADRSCHWRSLYMVRLPRKQSSFSWPFLSFMLLIFFRSPASVLSKGPTVALDPGSHSSFLLFPFLWWFPRKILSLLNPGAGFVEHKNCWAGSGHLSQGLRTEKDEREESGSFLTFTVNTFSQ